MDTRFFRRVSINYEIKALAQDGAFTGTLENISLGGLLIRTNKCISVGDKIEINIPLFCNFKTVNFGAKLIAIRIGNEGIAFKFNNLDPKNFWTLQSYIQSANA